MVAHKQIKLFKEWQSRQRVAIVYMRFCGVRGRRTSQDYVTHFQYGGRCFSWTRQERLKPIFLIKFLFHTKAVKNYLYQIWYYFYMYFDVLNSYSCVFYRVYCRLIFVNTRKTRLCYFIFLYSLRFEVEI